MVERQREESTQEKHNKNEFSESLMRAGTSQGAYNLLTNWLALIRLER